MQGQCCQSTSPPSQHQSICTEAHRRFMGGRDFGDKDASFHGVPFQVASTRHRRPRAIAVATRRKQVRVASTARSRVDRVQMRSAKAEWRIDRQTVSVPVGCSKHRPQRALLVTSRVQCGISDGTDSTWQAVLSRRGPMGRASAASANSLESSIGGVLVWPEFIGLQQPLGNLSWRWLKLDRDALVDHRVPVSKRLRWPRHRWWLAEHILGLPQRT